MEFSNKVVLITGAGAGIGKATALYFANKGCKVVVSDRKKESGQAVADRINALNEQAIFVAADVSNYEEMEHLFARTIEQFGKLDILVNNAGIGPRKLAPTADATLEDWNRVIAVNQTGVFYGMKLALAQMIKQGGGNIVNVASLAGLKASPNNISYAASKFAVVGMTKAAAQEYARYKIRINAVCPGYTSTDLVDRLITSRDDMEDRLLNFIPMRRFGKPEEIAASIAYLASDEAGFITGQTLVLDGGTSL